MNKKILINKSVWACLNHASSLSMRGIHVHALVTQRGLAKSVNKDNLIQAATSNDYHYNYHIIISISVSIFPSICQELRGKCKPLSFGAQYHFQYQYQYRYRYCYCYRYRCRYHNHYQCSYISKHFPGITRKVQTPAVWSTATEHNKLHTSGWMHILFFAWFSDWMLFLLWESSEDTSAWLCSSQHQSK